MTFPILGGNGAVTGAFSIDNSLRLNDDDTPKLAITPNASNRKTWTFSAWVKRSSLSSNQRILSIERFPERNHIVFGFHYHLTNTFA